MTKSESCDPRTVKGWASAFKTLYETPDGRRSHAGLWIATMGHCSSIGEAIRRSAFKELLTSAAHAFCWMLSYVNRCNELDGTVFHIKPRLCGIVALKYPGWCGHCMKEKCQCDAATLDTQRDKAADYAELLEHSKLFKYENLTLQKWLEVFNAIYGNANHLMTLETIGFHFLEEAGEMTVAVRKLLQLEGVIEVGIEGVDGSFLNRLADTETLVGEYKACLYHDDIPKERGKPKPDSTSRDPLHVKARLVEAKMDAVIELADTFSWYCGVLLKVGNIMKTFGVDAPRYDIEYQLQHEYGRKGSALICPTCKQSTCACTFFPKETPGA